MFPNLSKDSIKNLHEKTLEVSKSIADHLQHIINCIDLIRANNSESAIFYSIVSLSFEVEFLNERLSKIYENCAFSRSVHFYYWFDAEYWLKKLNDHSLNYDEFQEIPLGLKKYDDSEITEKIDNNLIFNSVKARCQHNKLNIDLFNIDIKKKKTKEVWCDFFMKVYGL